MMKRITLSLTITILMISICDAQMFRAIQKDFNNLSGSWVGSLTYLDYSSGKPYTMAADLKIMRITKTNIFVFSNIYPKEASANSMDTISISANGKYIGKESVKSRHRLANGDIEIITQELGKDGNENKPATIKHTYTIGGETFKNKKDVQFIDKPGWINRHEYSYKRSLKA